MSGTVSQIAGSPIVCSTACSPLVWSCSPGKPLHWRNMGVMTTRFFVQLLLYTNTTKTSQFHYRPFWGEYTIESFATLWRHQTTTTIPIKTQPTTGDINTSNITIPFWINVANNYTRKMQLLLYIFFKFHFNIKLFTGNDYFYLRNFILCRTYSPLGRHKHGDKVILTKVFSVNAPEVAKWQRLMHAFTYHQNDNISVSVSPVIFSPIMVTS